MGNGLFLLLYVDTARKTLTQVKKLKIRKKFILCKFLTAVSGKPSTSGNVSLSLLKYKTSLTGRRYF